MDKYKKKIKKITLVPDGWGGGGGQEPHGGGSPPPLASIKINTHKYNKLIKGDNKN